MILAYGGKAESDIEKNVKQWKANAQVLTHNHCRVLADKGKKNVMLYFYTATSIYWHC